MPDRIFQPIVAALLGVLVVIALVAFISTKGARWEYDITTVRDYNADADLERLGTDGWDVVSARRATEGTQGVYELLVRRRR